MATYVVTTSNWNSPAFWAGIVEGAAGHTLDFSGLGPVFNVTVDALAGTITISDGVTTFTVGEAGVAGTDASFGGATLLDYFTTISGAQGADTIEGTPSDDVLDGNAGDDSIWGGDGNDTLYGDEGADTLDGGTGNDTLHGEAGADTVYGGAGADLIHGGDGDDYLAGGWEDNGADTIFGGAGNDLVFAAGGNDSVTGGTGFDWIDGGAGDDHLEGNEDDDRIVGDLGNDTIFGGAGNDVLSGGEGADSIDGGDDADQIWGNAGDTIFGGEGGNDNDTLFVSHVDFITYTDAESGTITFNSGDTLSFSGIEQIVVTAPDGVVDGTSGDDQIGQFHFDADGDWIDNGDAIGEGDGDSVRAGDGNDSVWSNDGDDTVHGEAGDDYLYLGSGNNVAFGGAGADTIDAEWSNDTISGDDFIATGPNLIVNGSFEDTTGMNVNGTFGFTDPDGTVSGWTDLNGTPIDFHNDGRGGLNATDGANWMDMEAGSGQHNVISQAVAGVQDGQVYVLSFDVGDRSNAQDGTTADNRLQLIWNGEIVATIDASDGSWTSYEFHLIGGSGDGSNTLTFAGLGNDDAHGVSLDNVQMYATTEAAGGADSISGWYGDDDLMGGAGDDTIDAGPGADMVVAGSGADSVLGGDGDDTIRGGTGNNLADAGGTQTVVVSEEDFATAPTGWFDTATGAAVKDTARLNDGNAFLGNFAGNGTGAEQVSKTFTMVEGATSAVIAFDFLKLDSWDESNGSAGQNERFIVYIDGVAAFSYTPDGIGTGFGDGADASGSFAGGTWSVTSSGSDTEMFGSVSASWSERVYEVRITLDTPGDTVTLGIGTTTNQSRSDESWGIDNVRVEATGTLPADGADTIDAGAGADLVYGGAGDDSILGGDGPDTIYGGEGNDSIHAGHQADLVYGGIGNDTINVGGGHDLAYGEEGDDLLIDDSTAALGSTLFGGEGNDTILSGVDGATGLAEYFGDAGDDRFEDRGGTNQTFRGGAGSDTYVALHGIDNDTVIGGEDPGNADTDVIDLSALTGPVTVTWTGDEAGTITDGTDTMTFSEIERIVLTNEADVVDATADPNGVVIDAGGGDDSVIGSAGADSIDGGVGDDTIRGGDGDDTLIGGAGSNDLHGDAGNDSLVGNSSDGFTRMGGGAGADTLDGTAGSWDIANYFGSADGVNIDLRDGLAESGGEAEGDVLIGIEQIDASDLGNDTIFVDDRGMVIKTYGGADIVGGGDGADTIEGGDGSDLLSGGAGADLIDGGTGNDSLDGGAGDDTLEGGEGNDRILAGMGDDIVFGGADNDLVFGQDGADTLFGGDGDDTLDGDDGGTLVLSIGGSDRNGIPPEFEVRIDGVLVHTGTVTWAQDGSAPFDPALPGAFQDVLIPLSGNAPGTVSVTFTNDFVPGDDAAPAEDRNLYLDSIRVAETAFEAETDAVITNGGGAFGDYVTLWGTGSTATFDTSAAVMGGADSIDGGAGNDAIIGDGGNDTLLGGAGSDTIYGGDGDDSVVGGTGDDLIFGGAGNDIFVYMPGDGMDTIADFNTGNTGTLSDGDSTNNDFIDLTAFYDSIFELQADHADDGILNQSNTTTLRGQAVDYSDNAQFGPGGGIVFAGQSADGTSFTQENTGVVCFTAGTMILTERGPRPIELLRPGHRIVTRDNGPQKLRWVARRVLTPPELAARPELRPVWIRPDLIGAEAPLLVSPQHGVLMETGGDETLVRAIHLARLRGGKARVARGVRRVTYFHLLFDAHQIVFANGAPSESLYPGPMALSGLSADARRELRTLFPRLCHGPTGDAYGPTARRVARFRDLPPHLGALRALPPPRGAARHAAGPAPGGGRLVHASH